MSLIRSPKSSKQELPPTQSLLIPPNPQIVAPGSSPQARGGILLNPLGGDGDTVEPSRKGSDAGSSSKKPKRMSISSSGFEGGSRPVRTKSAMSSGTSASSYSSSEASTPPTSIAAPRTSSPSPKLKFAPLPQSGRQRSSSITLGVAARAAMLSGSGYGPSPNQSSPQAPKTSISAPHWQQNVAPPKPMWYNGGPVPDNVKTVKDIKPGLKKAWGKIRRSSSASRDGRSNSLESTTSASTSGSNTTSDMSAADEAVSLSDTSSMISDSSSTISEEDESDLAEEERLEAEAARGRPIGRTSPVHMHGSQHSQIIHGHPTSVSPEHMGHGSGDATPRRRHSPTGHAHHNTHLSHVYSNEGGTASGSSTPRRRMSLSDMHDDAAGDVARHGRHHQAVFGFDEKTLNSKFDSLGLSKQDSIATTDSRESENMRDEEDEPIPDSRQVSGAAREVAV